MPRFAPYGYAFRRQTHSTPFTGFLSVVTQANLMLSLPIDFAFELVAVRLVTTVVGTGAGATRLINIRKGSATGTVVGSVTATLANQGVLGVVTTGSVVTAARANAFNDLLAVPDTLTIEFPAAASVVFATGGFDLILTLRTLAQRAA